MSKRNDMPKIDEIVEFWSDRLIEMEIEELPVENSSCFVCGSITRLERCHILPLCEGGNNAVDNIHLLCRQCHDESESISGEIYWRWYREKRKVAYISPGVRAMMKVKAIFPDLDKIEETFKEIEPDNRKIFIEELLAERLHASESNKP